MHKIKSKPFTFFLLAIYILMMSPAGARAQENTLLITNESWSRFISLKGSPDQPVIISPLARLDLSENTQKVVIVPEELQIKDEIQEFRMFRNRYVIFGIYLSLALYYNWLTRYR